MTVKFLPINKPFVPLIHCSIFYASKHKPSAPRIMEQSFFGLHPQQYEFLTQGEREKESDDTHMEEQNALDTPSASTAVGGASDSVFADTVGDVVNSGLDLVAPFVPGGVHAVRFGRAISNAYNAYSDQRGTKRQRNGSPKWEPARKKDGSDGGDGGPPPSGPGGNVSAMGGSSGSALCCCPCDPKAIKYKDGAHNDFILDAAPNGTNIRVNAMKWDLSNCPVLLNGLAQGSDYGQRVGRKMNMRWLRIKLSFNDGLPTSSSSTDHIGNNVRVAILYDRQCNGNPPSIPTVFVATGTQDAYMDGLTNVDYRHRYIMLLDKTVHVSPYPLNYGVNNQYDFAINLRNLPTVYKGTGATVSDITTGSLYMCIGSNRVWNAAGLNNHTASYSFRLCYLDS